MSATTVNGQLLSPVVALPAGAVQVTLTLVDYDDAPVVGFNTTDSTEIVSTSTIIPTTGGLWTAQLVPNADIQLFNGSAQTAYRVVESGNGSSYAYWVIVTASVNPVWVGSLRTTLVGTTGGTAAAMAIAGGLTVGGAAVFNGTVTGSADPTLPLQLATKQYVDAHGSTQPWQFRPVSYGAFGDNTHDDTAAMVATVNAAVAYAQANHGYAEVVLDPVTYLLSSAPITGGSTQGSAQVPLPVIADTAQKVILVLRCTRDQSALYHWLQTTPQRAGAILRSTYDAGASVPATGEVSVVGGPTPHFLGDPPSAFSNMLVVVDGVGIELANPDNMCAFDFRCLAEANVPNAAVLGARTGTGAPAVPAANWGAGLMMPVVNNNDNCNIGLYSCEGLVYGLVFYEHLNAESIRIINCFDGIVCWSSSGFPHRNRIGYASIEGCQRCIVFAGAYNKLDITTADIEWGGGAIIDDVGVTPSIGRIGLGSNGSDGASLSAALSSGVNAVTVANGALALEIVNLDQKRGAVTAPSLPASTVALTNPFWRDAEVTIAGGTVTQISVDGANQLITSGTVTVPTGKKIALTYSVAPSWAWKLL